MPPKKAGKTRSVGEELSTVPSSMSQDARQLTVSVELDGECPVGDWTLMVLLQRLPVLETPWRNPDTLSAVWNRDAADPDVTASLADEPLVVLLRQPATGKQNADKDPYKDVDKAAAGTLDLLPLLLGESFVCARVDLVYVESGEKLECSVQVKVEASCPCPERLAVRMTLLRAACLPVGKTENAYVAALSVSKLEQPFQNISFGPSLPIAPRKSTWASLLPLRCAASSDYFKPEEDVFVDPELKGTDYLACNATEWNMCRRILIDNDVLKTSLSSPFIMEVAGLSKAAKPETRGHYMAMLDLKVLLEPGEFQVTVRVPLRKYDGTFLPEETPPMLDLPAPNLYNVPAPVVPMELESIFDENNHTTYVEIHFDVSSPIVPISSTSEMYQIIGKEVQESAQCIDDFIPAPAIPKPLLDVHVLKSECGALSLHSELEASITREQTPKNRCKPALAAHSVLKRTKQLIREHRSGETENFMFHDIVSGQHSAARRAVISSFEPQPPSPRAPSTSAAARARYAGNSRLADTTLASTLAAEPTNPRPLLSLSLRHLECFNDRDALEALEQALDKQFNNRYMLWLLGALESERGVDGDNKAIAAFYLTIATDAGEGTRRAITWAALHAHYHRHGQSHPAFVAARNMRKASEVQGNWRGLLDQWRKFSGEEEHLWDPYTVSYEHPLIMTAAMFLCLRAYNFAARLLSCSDSGCCDRGSRREENEFSRSANVRYLRAASALLQGDFDSAVARIDRAIMKHGPSCQRTRLRLACLASRQHWDAECEAALAEAERFGAPPDPAHLLRSAVFVADAQVGLQRAARAHKAAPSAQSALVIARLKSRLGRDGSAERWAAAAVGAEPLEADGWAELARQHLAQLRPREARAALRTARQAGPVSQYLLDEIKTLSKDVGYAGLPEFMAEELCICNP